MLVENLYFDRTGIPGRVHCFAKSLNFNHAIAHHSTPVEHIWYWYDPIVYMETNDVPGSAGYLAIAAGSHHT